MEVSLSAKPHGKLTLISSSSSPRFRYLQREFIGCNKCLKTYHLRPRRRKCVSLFQLQSQSPHPRFNNVSVSVSVSAYFEYAQPIIVIATTFSALTLLYITYNHNNNNRRRRRKDFDFNQLSTHKDRDSIGSLEITKQSKSHLKKSTKIGITNEEKPVVSSKSIPEEISGNGHLYEEREVHYQKNASNNEEALIGIASKSTGSDVISSNDSNTNLPHVVFGQWPELITEPVSSSSVKHALGETCRDKTLKKEELELQVSDYNVFVGRSSREEIYTFYKENQSGVRSLSEVGDLKTVSPYPILHKDGVSSLLLPNMLYGTKLPAESSHHASVYLEGKMPLECYKEGSSRKRKDFGNGGVFEGDVWEGLSPQKGQRNWSKFSLPNGRHADTKHDQSEYYSTYNRLLKDGRLADCIELLDLMEQQGLLDMDKIYHVKFFNTCKTQKAVKVAFRFTRLITNPTLSTFNMLLSVCANSQYSEGAFEVLQLVKEAGLKADCKLYTTLISTCAKSGKVDAMFEVFHEMVNAGVEPNVHTYGALIDGCARAGQVGKAFGAYGILRSKNVKPDRVVFNALITACGQSGAVDRAFDVLAEMATEPTPVNPDHVTVGALIKTCVQAGQCDRAREVYKMIHRYKIKGTPEVYTIAVNSCSQIGDLEFALSVYGDMIRNGVVPDEMFLSALIDVAGHAGKIDVAFEVLQEARTQGTKLGNVSHGSLMGACSNAKNWQKALELYEDLKAIKLRPTVSTMNALITALCHGDQLQKAVEVLTEMRNSGLRPNTITYSILLATSEKKNELELGSLLYSQAKRDRVVLNLTMYRCLIGMCLRKLEKAYSLGETVVSFNSGKPQLNNEWTLLALKVYREAIGARIVLTMEVFSLVLACLQFPHDTFSRSRLVEELGITADASCSNLSSLIDGFGEYDSRSFSLLEEAASLDIVPCVSLKESPIIVDARNLQIHTAEVYLLTVLKGLKHRLAAGAKLPNITIFLPVADKQILIPAGVRTVNLAGRVGQAVGALLRRLGLQYQGNESYGKIRINGISVKRWLQPKLGPPFSGKPAELNSSKMHLGKGIADQQRNIRTSNLSLDQIVER
ncbi:hypothetical protein GIB67_005400 [Kingdonia uniflora]|uniref:PROP1-like PPR domain-containing protein n=1 Tax=Kingdonia uniflora TaxID=39325 RepID=A0A7J7NI06_9MAGN|nr:hypothetical protein GIB67_005400 [Kingdonia uniflora]